MEENAYELIDTLASGHHLNREDYEHLLDLRSGRVAEYAASVASAAYEQALGNVVFIRGLIEISNCCSRNCLYCGIRAANAECERYRLTTEQIAECAFEGYELGMRLFLLQGGEDPRLDDEALCEAIEGILSSCPGSKVVISVGERTKESYQRLFDAGAYGYYLREETGSGEHYAKLHPASMSFEERMNCLDEIRDIGFAVGCGFMVGTPFQTNSELAADLEFIERFNPSHCGIGPFIPHQSTPFAHERAGSVDLTCFLLSVLRIMHPQIALTATPALLTLSANGLERGLRAGANVVMPKLTPSTVGGKYELYAGNNQNRMSAAEAVESVSRYIERAGRTLAF